MNTQTSTKPAAKAPGVLDLTKFDTVLVKFFFTNESIVPRGIPHVDRSSSYGLDFTHAMQAKNVGKEDLGKLGRHREDRVDTGEPVINNLHGVQASLLKDRLVKAGFALKNLHWMKQEKEGRTTKYVVVCEFVRGTQTVELPQDIIDALDFLSHCARWICHVWDNSAIDKPATINFVGRQPDGKIEYYLLLIDNAIQAVPAIPSEASEASERTANA